MPVAEKDTFERDLEEWVRHGGKVDKKVRRDDSDPVYAVDYQYLLMGRWAFDRVMRSRDHIVTDFGGDMNFLNYLSAFKKVRHYDIRKPDYDVWGLEYLPGDITKIPEEDNSLGLITCLHVAEHIGLGRYGDTVDPFGFHNACDELKRVLAKFGEIVFAVPVGRPQVVFNTHRVLSYADVIRAFEGLQLKEYSAIKTGGQYRENAGPRFLENEEYGCGLFRFTK